MAQRCIKCRKARKTKKGLCAACRPRDYQTGKVIEQNHDENTRP